MKSFISVVFFLIVSIAILGSVYYKAKKQDIQRQSVAQSTKTLYVYTDMSLELIHAVAKLFEMKTGITVDVIPLTENQILDASLRTAQQADIVISSQEVLQQLSTKQQLHPFISEQTDTVLYPYRAENGLWTGVWIDPIIFIVNPTFYKENFDILYTWDSVIQNMDIRISVTDFVTSRESENLLYCMGEHFGDEETLMRLLQLGKHVVQYGKYLSTPVRMVAMNKADVGISNYSEAMRAKKEQFPVQIIYPDDGQPWYLYGIGIYKDAPNFELAGEFVDWVLSEDLKNTMGEVGTYYLLTNDVMQEKDDRGCLLDLWDLKKVFVKEGRDAFKKEWISEVRFAKKAE